MVPRAQQSGSWRFDGPDIRSADKPAIVLLRERAVGLFFYRTAARHGWRARPGNTRTRGDLVGVAGLFDHYTSGFPLGPARASNIFAGVTSFPQKN